MAIMHEVIFLNASLYKHSLPFDWLMSDFLIIYTEMEYI